jgi:hypothetical protein
LGALQLLEAVLARQISITAMAFLVRSILAVAVVVVVLSSLVDKEMAETEALV